MKKIIKIVIVIFIIFAIIYMVVDKTTEIQIKLDGIAYRLGEENTKIEPSTLEFEGYKRVNLFQRYWFYGTVIIDDEEYFIDYYSGEDMWNYLHIPYEHGFIGELGYIFIDKDFKKVSITQLSDEGRWSTDGGMMLTYPAKSKSEAINISKDVMEAYFKKHHYVEFK